MTHLHVCDPQACFRVLTLLGYFSLCFHLVAGLLPPLLLPLLPFLLLPLLPCPFDGILFCLSPSLSPHSLACFSLDIQRVGAIGTNAPDQHEGKLMMLLPWQRFFRRVTSPNYSRFRKLANKASVTYCTNGCSCEVPRFFRLLLPSVTW